MELTVFGASGPTGRQVVRQALAAGHHVTAVTREPDRYPLTSPDLDVVTADVTDPEGVERVLSGAGAVISTYGVPYSRHGITVYSQGITTITRAMTTHGATRLACVSSTTVATGEAPGESLLWRKAVIPLLRNTVGRTLYDDVQRMEESSAAAASTGRSCGRPGCSTRPSPPTTTRSRRSASAAGTPLAPTSPPPWSGRPRSRSTRARPSRSSPARVPPPP